MAAPRLKPPGVYARHTELFDVVARDASIEKIAGGFGQTAGPVFSRIGYLLFCDVRGNRIHKWTPRAKAGDAGKGDLTIYRKDSRGACALTFDHQGRLLTCEVEDGRVTRTEKDGSITVLAERYEGKRLGTPADLVYAIDGSVYFTDRSGGMAGESPGRSMNRSVVCRIARTQIPGSSRLEQVSREYSDFGYPQGIALSPKQNLLYVSDAGRKTVFVHSIKDDGTLAPRRVFAEFTSDETGEIEGLKTDERGHVYAAGPGGLWVFNPAGKHLGTIVTPEPPSNCCWGSGFSSLYITAGTSIYHVATKIPGTRTF